MQEIRASAEAAQMPATITLPSRPHTYAELRQYGLSDWRIHRMLQEGDIRRVTRGVYVPADLEDSLDLRAACVALVVADRHVAVDRTAAWLHGVDVLGWSEHDVLPPVETCAIRGSNPTKRGDVHGMERDLIPRDLMRIGEVTVTTPLRTALDLGCFLRRREATAALNQFAAEHGVTKEMMSRELPRFRGRRGVVQLRTLIPRVEPSVESPRESWTLDAIDEAGLPRPVPQYQVEEDGELLYRLDFAYPKHRICIEYDGWEHHRRTKTQIARDKDRRRWLRDHGWTVIVIRIGDFTGVAIDRWLNDLREALGSTYSTRRW